MMDIKDIIKDMLTKNTGSHFLDSGSAYGRHWEENQGKDFENEPEIKIDYFEDELLFHVPVYHYLTNMLEFDEDAEKMNKKFEQYMEHSEDSYLADMETFADQLADNKLVRNTYNQECVLDQSIQFVIPYDDDFYDAEYIILSIHNGCDIRGGYTKPVIFKLPAFDYFLMGLRDVSANIDGVGTACSENAGYNFRGGGDVEFDFEDEEIEIDVGSEQVWFVDVEGNKHEIEFYSHLYF
jgi:hypothetical protein